jgi:hypothetical protein
MAGKRAFAAAGCVAALGRMRNGRFLGEESQGQTFVHQMLNA